LIAFTYQSKGIFLSQKFMSTTNRDVDVMAGYKDASGSVYRVPLPLLIINKVTYENSDRDCTCFVSRFGFCSGGNWAVKTAGARR
jgi:hypothetical protein